MTELMVTRAARELNNYESVLVGIGMPNLACNLAKRTVAPNVRLIYESGTIGSRPSELPHSIGDPVLASRARSIVSMYAGFTRFLQAGRIDVGFLGAAQIDRWGNLNSTVIGDYDDPKVRLPGSGGACEIASNAKRTVVMIPHEERRFPEEVDFITSPGYVGGRKNREQLRLPGGPETVITDKAVLAFDEMGEMYVETIHPDSSQEEIQSETGWNLHFASDVGETPIPGERELQIIRDELDPEGRYIG